MIDSLCFIPMKLANFPKTFGLRELTKGYFPHHFNTETNQNYRFLLLDAEYYDPDGMSPGDRARFYIWHDSSRANDYVFDFQEEILKYCRSDVDILRRCCLEFRELFRSVTDIDPFEKCLGLSPRRATVVASVHDSVRRATLSYGQKGHLPRAPRQRGAP